jgi:hypothetical protein
VRATSPARLLLSDPARQAGKQHVVDWPWLHRPQYLGILGTLASGKETLLWNTDCGSRRAAGQRRQGYQRRRRRRRRWQRRHVGMVHRGCFREIETRSNFAQVGRANDGVDRSRSAPRRLGAWHQTSHFCCRLMLFGGWILLTRYLATQGTHSPGTQVEEEEGGRRSTAAGSAYVSDGGFHFVVCGLLGQEAGGGCPG